ncbi:MAG: RidA family protein [Phaeodactylibacter sp.]|nr:RidA family protein [Phaeodactylibacter sp.]
MKRQLISSGAPWEATVGYSRAVKVGSHIYVAGTTAADEQGATVSPDDAYAQTKYIFEKIGRALEAAGASLENVVRTRMFVTDITQWEAIGRAHGEVFRNIRPAATMVEVNRLIGHGMLVEIEVDAVVG